MPSQGCQVYAKWFKQLVEWNFIQNSMNGFWDENK